MAFEEPRIANVKRISDPRGNLSVIERGNVMEFKPARCYWITDVPSGQKRDGHAYHNSRELIVALSGSIAVETESPDGTKKRFSLTRPDMTLIVPPMTWRELSEFTTNATVLIITSTPYTPEDYIRTRSEFTTLAKNAI